jgi:polysaccharide pyruvyl transferase WcaK-like protein
MRIALFGYYDQGNFGDDVMAVIIAKFLVEVGHEVRVFGLSAFDTATFGLTSTADISILLDEVDAVVVGGGGIFCKRHVPLQSSILYQTRLNLILDACKRLAIPIMGISLGGSGHTFLDEWQSPAIRLLRDAAFCTFRNPQDLKIGRAYSRPEFTWHPDLVWLTSRFFPKTQATHQRPRVAVNLSDLRWGRAGRAASRALLNVLERQTFADVYYVDTTNRNDQHFRAVAPTMKSSSSNRHSFTGILPDLEFLANIDLIVTTRLHAGLAAMSYGVPMISFFGYDKARLSLKNIGKSSHHISFVNLGIFLWAIGHMHRRNKSYTAPSRDQIEAMQNESMKHLIGLEQALRQCVAPSCKSQA